MKPLFDIVSIPVIPTGASPPVMCDAELVDTEHKSLDRPRANEKELILSAASNVLVEAGVVVSGKVAIGAR